MSDDSADVSTDTEQSSTEEPPENPQAPTPAPIPDPTPIPWEPQTWYSITYACRTPGCPNENITKSAPMFYTNDGQAKNIRVVDAADGACGKDCTILTATKLNPQPVEE
ncbi:hypothetical protein PV382_23350 [Streptomyces scabiei]|uniref:hypothetical protein n=1 Tax=Streptomyces scabiei TaxID=1930 RepID=UPI0029AAC45B|nr:hypothetical protein [Streptomyces scabiei]MDX3175189.1 hypothetical protein [Streptomyces scabiei]